MQAVKLQNEGRLYENMSRCYLVVYIPIKMLQPPFYPIQNWNWFGAFWALVINESWQVTYQSKANNNGYLTLPFKIEIALRSPLFNLNWELKYRDNPPFPIQKWNWRLKSESRKR